MILIHFEGKCREASNKLGLKNIPPPSETTNKLVVLWKLPVWPIYNLYVINSWYYKSISNEILQVKRLELKLMGFFSQSQYHCTYEKLDPYCRCMKTALHQAPWIGPDFVMFTMHEMNKLPFCARSPLPRSQWIRSKGTSFFLQ